MEFGERKRRRKSQSFKLVTDEDSSYLMKSSSKDAGREQADAAVTNVWVGDESMEIKKQITGMMRLLSDRAGRVYQRAGAEPEILTKDPQDLHSTWVHEPRAPPEELHSNSWDSAGEPGPSPSSAHTPNGAGCGQYSTRSRATRVLNDTKGNEANAGEAPPAAPEPPCCMCNCKGTLQAILQELRAMRKLMQTQKASVEKQERAPSPCQPRPGQGSAPRCRPGRRRPASKAAPSSPRRTAPVDVSEYTTAPADAGERGVQHMGRNSSPPNSCPVFSEVLETDVLLLNPRREPLRLESEVRLADDYDVFISKAQLDSILVNYTRSGSLLFRKLVCAFFDDTTLANSLPNGKRKRGLNDNRKGLDQNIVGAIKVFTEKYCTEHRIEKLPGPRDWVQILQDQIKLARRRLKRDGVEAEEVLKGPSTSRTYNGPAAPVEETVVKTDG